MEKIEWLRQLVTKQPEDAQTYYWLGKELAENCLWLDAIREYTTGLNYCDDEELRFNLIRELSLATQQLQLSTANSTNREYENRTTANKKKSYNMTLAENEDVAEEVEEDQVEEDQVYAVEERSHSIQVDAESHKLTRHPGLQIIDGGQKEVREESAAIHKITFKDVAGLSELKKTIQLRIISPFFNQGLFSKFRKKSGGGVLLYGTPGCGKTFVARATAGECNAHFYPVQITDVIDPYIGVSEQNLKSIFDKARSHKPSIMFFDEIDTIGYSRSKTSSSLMRGVIDTFLSEMEGLDTSTDQVLIIGATNLPWDVDNALKRPGRFDRMVFVAPPDLEARKQIFTLKLNGRFSHNIEVDTLANNTEFFSGADIDNVCERAAEIVLEEILETGVERPILMKDLEAALSEARPTTLEWLRTAKSYVRYSNQSGIYDDVEQYLRSSGDKFDMKQGV